MMLGDRHTDAMGAISFCHTSMNIRELKCDVAGQNCITWHWSFLLVSRLWRL